MPYRICKSFEIESAHMLAQHPEKCRFPHGHTRMVEFILEADDLDANGMVCDFKVIKELALELVERFDHAMCMNTADPKYAEFKAAYGERVIGFDNTEPTTEVMARTFFDEFQTRLSGRAVAPQWQYTVRPIVRVRRVRVWETSSSWAEFGGAE